ncbi:MAG TPA: CheR family methyltransferase [Longimicrobiales bacterium]|nr:CheR family methyltransferase [Longimicrobiales bacterium]
MRDEDCVDVLRWALPRLDMRWEGFRRVRRQVCRRIARRMAELGVDGVEAYRRRLVETPAEWEVLDGLCRVTISRFFRDRGVWEHLRRSVLPDLVRGLRPGEPLRAWSAGCGSGEEPYTLAILWRLSLPLSSRSPIRIVATDAEPVVLARARAATYPPGTLKELPEEWIEAAFEPGGEGFVLRPAFREPVELRRQDLRHGMPDGPFHVVLCRNLPFTYFVADVQARILEGVVDRMAPGGALVIGSHERLPGGDGPLERGHRSHPIHRRRR